MGLDNTDMFPVIDLTDFMSSIENVNSQCKDLASTKACQQIATSLRDSGCLVVRCPLVNFSDNELFLDMMEQYFNLPVDDKLRDVRPDVYYQVGATPCGTEKPRFLADAEMQASAAALPPEQRPTTPEGADCKWRFMWRVGPRPSFTRFPELNAEPVVPKGFPSWSQSLDSWGNKLLSTARVVAVMAALGFGLPANAFVKGLEGGPHLLAPTGSDLGLHAKAGTVLAGYHYDLNFLTVHGPCRFPGLFVWRRDGKRVPVRIPPGCLLLQAGRQMEYMTGGEVLAGMHEVVVTSDTLAALDRARAAGRPLWRVSSTVFTHMASDATLEPLGHFSTPSTQAKYPPVLAGHQVARELEVISLKAK